ncbi:MAG: hypothetical protein WCY19_08535 [Candidatus Gastranaerophilaceae bacterium]
MIQLFNAANIFSKLASNSSLLPMGIKDGSHSIGMTTASYITGKEVEGKDRFIDEAGTELIWIGGIPLYKKIIDLTVYKLAKQDFNVDVRLFEDKSKTILKKAIEHAANTDIKNALEKASKHKGLFQGLALGKFIASTALTLVSYWALTNFRHKHTEKNIIKQIQEEEAIKKTAAQFGQKVQLNTAPKQNNLSFGMNLDINALKNFMFNPVNNMMILDGGITAERLGESRNPQDFMGYVIKEGAFWGFMYFAGDIIQNHFIKKAAKKNHPIDLDIKVLQCEEFKANVKNGELEKALKEFSTDKPDEEIYEALFKPCEPNKIVDKGTISDNLIVKMAKKSGIIKTVKGKEDIIDTRFHIDVDSVKKIKQNIANFLEKAPGASENNGEALEKFLKKAVSLKKGAILKNIGITSFSLGVIVPGIMLAMRYIDKDNKEFQVKKDIHAKLQKEGSFA